MEQGVGIHSCSELTSVNLDQLDVDQNCLDGILKDYVSKTPIPINVGTTAAVFKIGSWDRRHDKIAIKAIPYSDHRLLYSYANRELVVACKLQDVHNETPVFIQVFGYLICSDIPQEWRAFMPSTFNNMDLYMFLFMESPPYRMDSRGPNNGPYEIPLTLHNADRALFFLLLHGIYVARKHLQFVHADISLGNIMFAERETKEPFRVDVLHNRYEVHFLEGFTPKFIDFGRSSIEGNQDPDTYGYIDVDELSKVFLLRDDLKQQKWLLNLRDERTRLGDAFMNNVGLTKGPEYKVLGGFLVVFARRMPVPQIQLLKEEDEDDNHIDRRFICTMCDQKSVNVLEGKTTDISFCSQHCASKIQTFHKYIPTMK